MTDLAILGRSPISRGPFIVRAILYNVLPVAVAIALGLGAGIAHQLGLTAQTPAAAPLGLAALILMLLVGLVFIWLMIRLVAARARDIGWSPLLVVAVYLVLVQLPLIVLALVPGKSR